MNLFKDKQLRKEFEDFKKDVLKKFKKLEKENASLKEECTFLNKECVALHGEISALKKQDTPKKESPKKEVPKKQTASKTEVVVEFGGNTINNFSQSIYNYLKFDGFWFKSARGKNSNKQLVNIHQILFLKSLQHTSDVSWANLGRASGINPKTIQKIAFNIIKGTFDKYIDEYHNTQFTFKKGLLCINGKPTNLSAFDVQEIIDCYVNNKSEKTISKLIKTYSKTKREHVITICDNYDSVRLKRQVNVIDFENNPQKRKEKGMS